MNSFKQYLIEIGKYPLLTPEQEKELGRRIKENHDQKAREQLILSNLRLVVYFAKNYKSSMGIEELVSEGNEGLIKAVDRFDYTQDTKFSTYAAPWIHQAIKQALGENGRAIRLSANTRQQLLQMKRFIDSYTNEHNEKPSVARIADELGITEDKVYMLFQWNQDVLSMDMPLDDEDKSCLGDTIPSTDDTPDEYTDKVFTQEAVQKMLDSLPERTRIIMKMRYGLGGPHDPADWQNEHTLEDIGLEVGLTRERVRQIEKETLMTLRSNWKDLSYNG